MKNEQKSIGFGFALLGTSNTNYISDEEAENIFQCIIDHGILRFDTAPLYGGGLSEERLGKLLIKIPVPGTRGELLKEQVCKPNGFGFSPAAILNF